MKRYGFLVSLSIVICGLFVAGHTAQALTPDMRVRFTAEAIQRGYTASFDAAPGVQWGNFLVGILPGLVNERINLDLKQFNESGYPDPDGMKRVSNYYLYDILRQDKQLEGPLVLNKPFHLALKFDSGNLWRKRIFYWSSPARQWVPLPSFINYDTGYVYGVTHLPFSRVAVFEDQNGTEGYASWYRSTRYPYGAASNDFPMGAKLRVRNVDNGKIVDVEVVSTGPFRPFNERRVIDLSLTAFEQIENRYEGTARVQVSRLDNGGTVLGSETVQASVPEPRIGSAAVITIQASDDRILYSKNFDTSRPLASITKLMTALVFLDTDTPFDRVVAYAGEDNAIGSSLSILPGETLTVKDLWYTMLVGSANNAAKTLARATGLSTEEFVSRMNAKAKAWGLTHTRFVDVTGLDPANTSTVYDISRLAKRAFADFRIMQATSTWTYSFSTISAGRPHTIKNTSTGMQGSPYVITGMKTGYLDEAGYCYVIKTSRTRGEPEIVTVVLGAGSDRQRWDETKQLIQYGLSVL
ncbi:MAG: RlpA-like double-psi beta-barrel domain-containing protein [Patescibacteria group bacterium]